MARPLVIGVAEGGVASLPADIRDRLAGMDLVVAAPRFRDGLPDGPETIDWPSPFSDIFNVLSDNPDKSVALLTTCLLYTSPSPRDQRGSRMPSSA